MSEYGLAKELDKIKYPGVCKSPRDLTIQIDSLIDEINNSNILEGKHYCVIICALNSLLAFMMTKYEYSESAVEENFNTIRFYIDAYLDEKNEN